MGIYNFTRGAIERAIAILSPRTALEYRRAHLILDSLRSYDAAKTGGPNQRWNPGSLSGDSELRVAGQRIRNRVKDLERNHAVVAGAIRRLVANVVGEGNFPQSKIRMPDGKGLDKVKADIIEQAFLEWAENCCVNGDSLAEAQVLVQRHKTLDGEAFVIQSQTRNLMKIQVIEADQLAVEIDGPLQNGNYAVKGIELNRFGAPVSYHFYEVHPSDGGRFSSKINVIPASRVFHVFQRERASTCRGVSIFASVVQNIFNMGELSDATMLLSRLATAYGIFIKTPNPDEFMNASDTGADTSSPDPNKRFKYVDPAGIHYLNPEEEPFGFTPPQPGPIYEPFMRMNMRSVASGIGQSYSAISGDYSQGNFSSERQAMLLERALFRMEGACNDRKFNVPLFRSWLDWAVLTMKIDLPGYYLDTWNHQRVKFSRPRQEYINPSQDVAALKEQLNEKMISLTEIIEDRGQDRDDVFNAIADDEETLLELGIGDAVPLDENEGIKKWLR